MKNTHKIIALLILPLFFFGLNPHTVEAFSTCSNGGNYISMWCFSSSSISGVNTSNNNNNDSGNESGSNTETAPACVFSETIVNDYGITEGALIRAKGDIDVYIVKYVCNKRFKRYILNPEVFESYGHFSWNSVMDVDPHVLDHFETSNFVRATSAGDKNVYRLYPDGDMGVKRRVDSEHVFINNGWDWDSIYTINEKERNSYTNGSALF